MDNNAIVVLVTFFLLLSGCGTVDNNNDETVTEGEETADVEEGNGIHEDEISPEQTPPEPRIFETGGVVYAPATASFSIEAEDLGCGVEDIEISVDREGFGPYKNPIRFEDEGVHKIEYKARDFVGNVAPEISYTVTIDKTPPETEYRIEPGIVEAGNDLCVTPDCRVYLIADDNLSGVYRTLYSIGDNDFTEYGEFIGLPSPGAHIITYRSQDNVGTWETTKSLKLIVDGENPKSKLEPSGPLFESDGNKWAPPTHRYYLSATDDIIGVEEIRYSIDGSKFAVYTEPIELKPGTHKIVYYAVDRANNKEEKTTFEVKVDNEYPLTSINANPNN